MPPLPGTTALRARLFTGTERELGNAQLIKKLLDGTRAAFQVYAGDDLEGTAQRLGCELRADQAELATLLSSPRGALLAPGERFAAADVIVAAGTQAQLEIELVTPQARPFVDAPCRAGLAHDDLAQPGQRGGDALPDPAREVLAGRVLEPLDLVQVVVVELGVERLEGGLDLGEVHEPAELLVHLAAHVQRDLEGVPVQAGALVVRRDHGQPVRGLERELLEDLHRASGCRRSCASAG